MSLILVPFCIGAIAGQQPLTDEETDAALQAITSTSPIPADEAPTVGTFYSAQHGDDWPPMPGNMGLPVWNLGDGIYLIDDLNSADSSEPASKTGAMTMSVPDLPPDDGGTNYDGGGGTGGYTNYFFGYSFDTNGLWLELTNVASGFVSGNLHNATNSVYAILSNTNLLTSSWNIEQAIWPVTNQQMAPFTMATLDRQDLFLRAMDWTGVTHGGNTIPDWWFWSYFGTTNLLDTDLDSQGNTLLSDYQNGTDPNVISFSASTTNNYVNAYAAVQLNIASGSPSYVAVSVDDTNYAVNASWQSFVGTNLTVNIGFIEGWHDVRIGLRGLPENATQTWQSMRLKLDLTPPMLVVSNPISSTVDVPVIQLQGFCPEGLADISYDLSNASGLVTNQQVLVLNQFYDTNTWELTTNSFQAFDVQLTNGLNTITLRACDLAGNITITNFNIILDYSSKTNPPVVQVSWPKNNSKVCGNDFILNGWVSDPTSKVIAQMVDSSGQTNIFKGSISRNGRFQTERIPLNPAPGTICLTICDAAGNTTNTSITVLKGDVGLSIDPVSINNTRVTGKINSNDYKIWVNGVQGVNKGDGTWLANISPIGFAGGIVEAVAIVSADESQNQSAQTIVQPSIGIYANTYTSKIHREYADRSAWETHSLDWTAEGGGTEIDANENWQIGIFSFYRILNWPVGEVVATGTRCINGDCEPDWDIGYPPIEYEHSMNLTENHNPAGVDYGKYGEKLQIDSQTTLKLVTGGEPGSTERNLFVISCDYCQIGVYHFGFGSDVPFEKVKIGTLGKLGADGKLYVILPDNAPTIDVTPNVPGLDWYSFYFTVQKCHSYISANGVNLETNTPEFCVGQQVTFTLNGLPPYVDLVGNWTLPDKFVNEKWQLSIGDSVTGAESYYGSENYRINDNLLKNTNSTSCWYVNKPGGHVSVGMSLKFSNGQFAAVAANGDFTIFRPSISDFQQRNPASVVLDTNTQPLIYLGLGDNQNQGGSMQWDVNINLSTNFGGTVFYTQLINRNWFWDQGPTIPRSKRTSGYALDNVEISPLGTHLKTPDLNRLPDQLPTTFGDGPALADYLSSYADLSDSFQAYLRFQPVGGIPVTIARVDWGWHGVIEGTRIGLSSDKIWTLTTRDVTPSTCTNDDSFPLWTETLVNTGN